MVIARAGARPPGWRRPAKGTVPRSVMTEAIRPPTGSRAGAVCVCRCPTSTTARPGNSGGGGAEERPDALPLLESEALALREAPVRGGAGPAHDEPRLARVRRRVEEGVRVAAAASTRRARTRGSGE